MERVDVEFVGQLVHRAFERIHAPGGARRAHVDRRVQVEWHDCVTKPDVVTLVQHARPIDDIFAVLFELRRLGDRLVDDGFESAVGRGAERQFLPGLRTMAEGEHLLARQRDFHRAFQLARRHDREKQLILGAQTRPECPADKRRDDTHLVCGQPEHLADVCLVVLHPLGFVIDGHGAVMFPDDGSRERLHRIVMFNGQVVCRFQLDGGAGKGVVSVAARFRRRLHT